MHLDERRKIIAEKLFELANIEAGVIVFSELAGRGGVRSEVIVFGSVFFVLFYAVAYLLLTKQNL